RSKSANSPFKFTYGASLVSLWRRLPRSSAYLRCNASTSISISSGPLLFDVTCPCLRYIEHSNWRTCIVFHHHICSVTTRYVTASNRYCALKATAHRLPNKLKWLPQRAGQCRIRNQLNSFSSAI